MLDWQYFGHRGRVWKQGRLCFCYFVGDGPITLGNLMKNWIILCMAGLFEVVWAIGLKYTDGFTRLWPSLGTAVALLLSIGLLSCSMQHLPAGTAYAVWVGVGVIGTAIVGMALLGEPISITRLVSLGFIMAGIVGLKLSANT